MLAVVAGLSGGLWSAGANGAAVLQPAVTSPPDLAHDRILGRPDAPATLVVWSDFQCPSCGNFARYVEPRLVREFVQPGTLKIEYRDFAFIGDESTDAATAARCAGRDGLFWAYHDLLFANQRGENEGAFSHGRLVAIAQAAGVAPPSFEACLSDASTRQAVADETAAGRAAGVAATPTLVLGDQVYRGVPAWDELAAAIEKAAGRPSGSRQLTPGLGGRG